MTASKQRPSTVNFVTNALFTPQVGGKLKDALIFNIQRIALKPHAEASALVKKILYWINEILSK